MSAEPITPAQVVGRAVRGLRVSSGLTQAELAERLHRLDWGSRQQSAVASLEGGGRRIDIDDLCRIASVFGVSPQALLVTHLSAPIRVGNDDLTPDAWHKLMRVTREDSRALWHATRKSIPEMESIKWQRRLNRQAARVVLASREKELAGRAKFPGPTFVADSQASVDVPLPDWGVVDRIELVPGIPHVARDRLEADALLDAAGKGVVRRIDRHEARRMRSR